MVTPLPITSPAAASWAASFGIGPSEKRSSSSPATKRIPQPPRIAMSSRVAGAASTATASQKPVRMPAKIPIPPSMGVVRSCQRSDLGAAASRAARGLRSSIQMAAAAAGKAAIAASAFTDPKRNEGL